MGSMTVRINNNMIAKFQQAMSVKFGAESNTTIMAVRSFNEACKSKVMTDADVNAEVNKYVAA